MPIHGLSSQHQTSNTHPTHFDIEKVIRPNILSLLPYRCARDDYQSGILLDANENALGHVLKPDRGSANDYLHSFSSLDLNRYPDPTQLEIKSRIANLRNLKSEHVFLGVGSDEVIDLLIRICCVPAKEKLLITPPTYGMYAVCAHVNDVGIVKVPLVNRGGKQFQVDIEAIQQTIKSDPFIKLILLCSPGNPTGTLIPLSDIRKLLEDTNFKGILVVDEAYIDFADPYSNYDSDSAVSAVCLIKEYSNICVMQTLSKSFGLAAIRLGIALAQPPLIQILSNTKAPYNISTPSSLLALEALSPPSIMSMRQKVKTLITGRGELITEFERLAKLGLGLGQPLGGNDANFVLIPVTERGGEKPCCERSIKVYEELAERRGVVVRYRGDQVGCDGCLRITVGTSEENKILIKQLEDVLRMI
ncbi:hypothetical protein Clacol_004775 [Clathrus columnatus]|uniref:histidinol-phosphate transaminase n=1 Tax=Clathrus columnatus TaxID=1419009 RepID=A0AAV5AAP5_9AGAM|nr:hypothetical protein Clacol_004775 [Clathrus columnatus]